MSKSSNQKTKLLHLYRILLRKTDEEHPLTVQQLIEELARLDIKAERKSIYDDLEALRLFGLDVQCRKGKVPGWFVGGRDFELPEVKLLMDAVLVSYLADSQAKLEKLFEDPTLLRTPVVRNGRQATVGFCPEVWETWK